MGNMTICSKNFIATHVHIVNVKYANKQETYKESFFTRNSQSHLHFYRHKTMKNEN